MPAPPRPVDRRQSRAVLLLSAALAALATLWLVGGYLLLTRAPDLGPLPGATPTPSATR